MQLHSDIISISITPKKIAYFLGGIALFLAITGLVGQIILYGYEIPQYSPAGRFIHLFELGAEETIPTDFSALLLLSSALLLFLIFLVEKSKENPSKLYWLLLSVVFLFLTADEVYSAHEQLVEPIQRLLGRDTFGIFYFAWVIPYLGGVAILAVILFKFLFELPAQLRNVFLLSATIYIGGAVGLELAGGYYAELYGSDNLIYSIIQTVEESMEMAGVILFIWGLLIKIYDDFQIVQFISADARLGNE